MENITNVPNEAAPILNKLTPDDVARCPNCNLICSLKLNFKEGEPMIKYECENEHIGNILLKDYLIKYNQFALSKEKCIECNKTQMDVKGNMLYCPKCDKFLCYLCQIKHSATNHNMIFINRYDSICKIHSNSYCFYCIQCKKNLCIYCQDQHKSHEIINLSKLFYSEEAKNKLKDTMKDIENKINNLDIIKQNIIDAIDKLKIVYESEIKFFKILLYSYDYEENQNNLNYNIIGNLKDFENKFDSNQSKIYERVYEESDNYISFIKSSMNIISNPFKKNFKQLEEHTDYISYIDKLQDGRLVSCSFDNSLNIYNNDTYELQLSIEKHTDYIRSFTQIKDGRIITCSSDNTMLIIRLIEEDKYKIEQILRGHTNEVCKIIEIKENELISISSDNTMKIWKLNREKKFQSIKNINFQNSNDYCIDILKLNKNEFVTSSSDDMCIKFWNSNFYTYITTINNIETNYGYKIMCLLGNDILCIGGSQSQGFYLIQILTHQLIKNIIGPKRVYCIHKCFDGLLLCAIIDKHKNHNLIKYKYENQNLIKIIEKKNAHDEDIYSCVELNEDIIASGGEDNLIKLWKK